MVREHLHLSDATRMIGAVVVVGAWMEGRPGPRTVHAERSMHSCLQSEREREMEPTEESGLGEEPQAFSAWFTAQSTGFCGTINTHTHTHTRAHTHCRTSSRVCVDI